MNYNKLKFSLSLVLVLFITAVSAQSFENASESKKATLNVMYFENEPYAYKNEKGDLVGIEIDIMNS
ncbi:MAG: ABC-type amino acid transport substrate-binding protein, partial [Vicingaceae bacterium]